MAEVPRSTFQFDFDFEKKILAEAEKGSQNWSRIVAETPSTKTAASTSSVVHIFFAAFFTIKKDLTACACKYLLVSLKCSSPQACVLGCGFMLLPL